MGFGSKITVFDGVEHITSVGANGRSPLPVSIQSQSSGKGGFCTKVINLPAQLVPKPAPTNNQIIMMQAHNSSNQKSYSQYFRISTPRAM